MFERAGRPGIAIEVKRASAPAAGKGFRLAADDLKVKKRYVVYPGSERYTMGGDVIAMPLADLLGEFTA